MFPRRGFLSTPSVWRATYDWPKCACQSRISIHALRVEGDPWLLPSRSCRDYFYPRPPCGGRPDYAKTVVKNAKFLSTPSVWRATTTVSRSSATPSNFYPRPPCGGRQYKVGDIVNFTGFLSTPSVWRATSPAAVLGYAMMISIHALRVEGDALPSPGASCARYFYPRPPCGGRRLAALYKVGGLVISIHALRVEGDQALDDRLHRCCHFYPRPPCGGRRVGAHGPQPKIQFLSTPSVWRATRWSEAPSTKPSRISIHALRVEGDARRVSSSSACCYFYPRPPCGGRPAGAGHRGVREQKISIHALRVEGDRCRCLCQRPYNYFYPRPPCGGRPMIGPSALVSPVFLSTPSVWRATHGFSLLDLAGIISIHALRVEGDRTTPRRWSRTPNFYPRPPCGGRHIHRHPPGLRQAISIHALRVEGDTASTASL